MSDLNESLLNNIPEVNTVSETYDDLEIEKNKEKEEVETTIQTQLNLLNIKLHSTENFNSKENIKILEKWDWRLKQIEKGLQSLSSDKKNFYEIKEDWSVEYYMDLVKDYLNHLKWKSRAELKSKNTAALIMAVQIALEYQWYDVWKIDGTYWNQTEIAIKTFKSKMKSEWAKIMINWRPDASLIAWLLSWIDAKQAKDSQEDNKDIPTKNNNNENEQTDSNSDKDPNETSSTKGTDENEDINNTPQEHSETINTTPDKIKKIASFETIKKKIYWKIENGKFKLYDEFELEHDEEKNMDYVTVRWEKVYCKINEDNAEFWFFEDWELVKWIKYNADWSYFKWAFKNWQYEWEWDLYLKLPSKSKNKFDYNNMISQFISWKRENWQLVNCDKENKLMITYEWWKAIVPTPKWTLKLAIDEDKLYPTIRYLYSTMSWYIFHKDTNVCAYDFTYEWDNLQIIDHQEPDKQPSSFPQRKIIFENCQEQLWLSAEDISNWMNQYRQDLRDEFIEDKKAKEEAERRRNEERNKQFEKRNEEHGIRI